MSKRNACLGCIRIWAVLALLVLPSSYAFAEEDERTARNSIYVEGLGPGLAYSVNYDRMVIDDLAVRVGVSYMSYGASASSGSSTASASITYLTFPITASWVGVHSRSSSTGR